jgi:hypothetical protein
LLPFTELSKLLESTGPFMSIKQIIKLSILQTGKILAKKVVHLVSSMIVEPPFSGFGLKSMLSWVKFSVF